MAEAKFEKDMEKIEKIVEALTEGELTLDDTLKKFEEGIKLTQRCDKILNAAEKKIEVLTKNANGDIAAKPLKTGEEAGDEPDGGEDGELLF